MDQQRLYDQSFKYNARYADSLYPRIALAVYDMVLTGRWIEGNPEQAVDIILHDWLNHQKDRDDYIKRLKSALQEDKRIMECTVLRLNYAALLVEDLDTIIIHTNRQMELPFTRLSEHVQTEFGLAYTGKNASEMKLDEIEEQANNFYKSKQVIKQRKIGVSADKRSYIKNKIIELDFTFIEDLNLVYSRLNQYLYDDYETSIIARLAYLVIMSGDDLRSGNELRLPHK
jgi:hypothetical protein